MLRTPRREFLSVAGAGAAAATLGASFPFTSPAQAADSKTLVFATAGTVTSSWDPTSHTVAPQIELEGFYFGRLTNCPMDPGNPDEILPDLATSWKLVDKYTLEYKLRQGVTFHDGKPFKAEDVKATYEYACQPKHPASAWYPGLVDVEVVDDYTVRLHTQKYGYPALTFWYVVSFLPILSAKDVANPKVLQERPNGTGPFRYVSTKGDSFTFAAFDKYHGGRPFIDTLVCTYVPDANTRTLGLLNGQYHLTERLEPEQYLSLKKNAAITTSANLSSENKYLLFRCNKKPFDDVRVRMAACHAIDRSQIDKILGVAGKATSCFVSPLKFGFLDLPNYPDYSPEKCQKLLAEAGFPRGKGLPELDYITSIGFYPKTREYGQLIAAMMNEQGFNVKLTVYEPASWEEHLYRGANGQGPGHMIDCGWITGSPEPDLVLRPLWYSKEALITGNSYAPLDAALEKERNATSIDDRKKILQTETLPMLAERVPSLSLFSQVYFHAMTNKLTGVYFYPNGPVDLSKAKLA